MSADTFRLCLSLYCPVSNVKFRLNFSQWFNISHPLTVTSLTVNSDDHSISNICIKRWCLGCITTKTVIDRFIDYRIPTSLGVLTNTPSFMHRLSPLIFRQLQLIYFHIPQGEQNTTQIHDVKNVPCPFCFFLLPDAVFGCLVQDSDVFPC